MQQETSLRRGERVRVTRQDPEKAKLAVYGYEQYRHFGDDGVVTEIRETEDGTWYVVRFDDYGKDAVAYRSRELETP